MLYRSLIFALWFAVAGAVCATLTAWHSLALPTASDVPGDTRNPAGSWLIAHYLSADCPCSQAVAAYLRQRRPLPQDGRAALREEVFIIGPEGDRTASSMAAPLARAGFAVRRITAEAAAARYGVEGVPLLSITAPDGRVRFRGGYRERNAAPGAYLDVVIYSRLLASQPVPHPRVFGCATSSRLKNLLDPLSLKELNKQ